MIDAAILTTIQAVAQRHKSTYSVPSQIKILELLAKFHGITLSRRALNYRLASLQARGALNRIVRHYRRPDGVLQFRSTAYYILPAAHKIMKTVANLANRFFFGSRVQPIAQYLDGNYICNKDKMKSTIKTSLFGQFSGPLKATLDRMTLRFNRI